MKKFPIIPILSIMGSMFIYVAILDALIPSSVITLLILIITSLAIATIFGLMLHKCPKILEFISYFIKNSKVVEVIDSNGFGKFTIATKIGGDGAEDLLYADVYWASKQGQLFLHYPTNTIYLCESDSYMKWWLPYDINERAAALLKNDFPDFKNLRDKYNSSIIIR